MSEISSISVCFEVLLIYDIDILQGPGLVILEDGTIYDGEMGWSGPRAPLSPYCGGKGALYYPAGDCIEGTFHGPLQPETGGLRISSASLYRREMLHSSTDHVTHTTLGSLCANVNKKWNALFAHYLDILGIEENTEPSMTNVDKIWQHLVRYISSSCNSSPDDNIAVIPVVPEVLSTEALITIQQYLCKAFSVSPHPLAELLSVLVSSFRASYSTCMACPALILPHALAEVIITLHFTILE